MDFCMFGYLLYIEEGCICVDAVLLFFLAL